MTTRHTAASAQVTEEVAGVQRRTLATLMTTQAFGGVGVSAGVAVAALLVREVSGSETMAGLAQTSQVLGAALITGVLARVMNARGRRVGLSSGYLLGASGALLCVLGGILRQLPVLLTGTTLLGAGTAANNQARYAAADLATPAHHGRAISLVVWTTAIGSILGPNLAEPGARLAGALGIPKLTGPFLFGATGLVLGALIMSIRLRPDPLLLARELRAPATQQGDRPRHDSARAGLAAVKGLPIVRSAAIALGLNQAVMVSVMVMTSIHMDHGGSSLHEIGWVISGHILGMYAFAPLVGALTDRFGGARVMGAASVTNVAALVLAGESHSGTSWQLGIGLFLLGLGWSFGMIASSTVINRGTPLGHRPAVQGLTDMTTGFTAAAGGALAGVIMGGPGYGALNVFAGILNLGVLWGALSVARGLRAQRSPLGNLGGSAAVD